MRSTLLTVAALVGTAYSAQFVPRSPDEAALYNPATSNTEDQQTFTPQGNWDIASAKQLIAMTAGTGGVQPPQIDCPGYRPSPPQRPGYQPSNPWSQGTTQPIQTYPLNPYYPQRPVTQPPTQPPPVRPRPITKPPYQPPYNPSLSGSVFGGADDFFGGGSYSPSKSVPANQAPSIPDYGGYQQPTPAISSRPSSGGSDFFDSSSFFN